MNNAADTMEFEPSDPPGRSGLRRRQIVVGVVAAMLIAAAGGVGYGLGRNFDDSAGTALPESSPTPATDAPVATDSAVPTSVQASATDELAPGDGSTNVAVVSSGGASGSIGWTPFGSQPSEVLFERTTPDGFTLRAQLGESWMTEMVEDGSGWMPAAWCYPTGQLRVAMAGNGVIDVGSTSWYDQPYEGRSVSWTMLGGADSQPHWVVAVQTPADTSNVTVTFADGATDSVAPQNGVALLAVPGVSPPPPSDTGDFAFEQPAFDVTFEGGSEPVVVDSAGAGMWTDPAYQESCTPPPPALPEPGEQPADPVAAEAAIVDAMTKLYDGTEQGELDLVDDATGIEEARAQVREGGFSNEADTAQATIEELVFTTPTEAWFRYRVDTAGAGLTDRFGIAVVVDGTWRITRNTICQDLSMAGGDCGAGWQPIYPPGSEIGVLPIDESGIGD